MRRLSLLVPFILGATLLVTAPSHSEVLAPSGITDAKSVVALPDGHRVVLASKRAIEAFTLGGDRVARVSNPSGDFGVLGVSSSGEQVLVPSGSSVEVRSASDLQVDRTLAVTGPAARALDANGSLWVGIPGDQHTEILDTTSGAPIATVSGSGPAALTPAGEVLLADETTAQVARRSAATGELLASYAVPADLGTLTDLDVTPDGAEIFLAGTRATVALDAASGTELRRYPAARQVSIRQDGMVVVTEGGRLDVFAAHSNVEMNRYQPEHLGPGAFAGDLFYFHDTHMRALHYSGRLDRLRPGLPVSLAVTAMDTSVHYRHGAVRLTLDADSPERTVDLSLDVRGNRGEIHYGTVEVPPGQAVKVRLPLEWNGEVVARYTGDTRVEDAIGRSDNIFVEGRTISRAVDFQGRAGKYHLVQVSKAAKVVARIYPLQPGGYATASTQQNVHGNWTNTHFIGVKLNKDSVTGLSIAGRPSYAGIKIRVSIGGDSHMGTSGSSGRWVYFRFVR